MMPKPFIVVGLYPIILLHKPQACDTQINPAALGNLRSVRCIQALAFSPLYRRHNFATDQFTSFGYHQKLARHS